MLNFIKFLYQILTLSILQLMNKTFPDPGPPDKNITLGKLLLSFRIYLSIQFLIDNAN